MPKSRVALSGMIFGLAPQFFGFIHLHLIDGVWGITHSASWRGLKRLTFTIGPISKLGGTLIRKA